MYINGKFVQGNAKDKIEIINPATEDVLEVVWQGTEADVNSAVAAAKSAQPHWQKTPGMEKTALMHQAAAKMREHHDALVELLTKEEGKPSEENDEEVWWTEETFGPVIPLMPYQSFDEAIELANDNQFGLGASLMSHDAKLVKRFFENVQAGTIWINDPLTDNFAGPFGGMKMSGGGRELGQAGFDEFTQVKHVHWDIEGKLKEYWFPYGNN